MSEHGLPEPSISGSIREVLAARGPMTGAELHEAVGASSFAVWKRCQVPGAVVMKVIGRRYVRLDRTVEGFARLSPSLLREFMTYTVVGLPGQEEAIDKAAQRLQKRTTVISGLKLRTASRFTEEVLAPLVADGLSLDQLCVLVAGDIVYDMSHDVTRVESSTGSPVDGSDLDLIWLASDDLEQSWVEAIDAAILSRKWLYLRNPGMREEVDYVVKRFAKLVEQSSFDTFPHMVACKVFDEAKFVAGNRELHEAGRRLLAERGVLDRLREMEAEAAVKREARYEYLLGVEGDELPDRGRQQFYTDDEAAEFEH